MVKELTDKEFIEMFSEEEFVDLSNHCFEAMRGTPEYKNGQPKCYSIMAFPKTKQTNAPSNMKSALWTIVAECMAEKKPQVKIAGITGRPVYFSFVRIWISDEDMPDIALDRYNEYLRARSKSANNKQTNP